VRLLFAGTPEFAVPTLLALLEKKYDIPLVLTQPSRPTGRGQKPQCSAIKTVALQHHLNLLQPESLKTPDIQALLKSQKADVMIVVAYGMLLPKPILMLPRFGCINVHASLLPRWRGAAPIPYAILAGDKQTGITIMKMDEGLDTGDILLQESIPITSQDTTHSLQTRLANLGATLLIKNLDDLQKTGKLAAQKQNENEVTSTKKILKTEGLLDWTHSAILLERKVRAFNPWPRTYFYLNKTNIRVWEAEVIHKKPEAPPGTLLEVTPEHLYIACNDAIFSPLLIQFAGKNPTTWTNIYNAHRSLFQTGSILLTPPSH